MINKNYIKNYCKLKGKKGATDIFLDVVSYFLLIVIIIVFFLLFHIVRGCNNPISVNEQQIVSNTNSLREGDMYLINLMKSPVKIDGEDKDISDLIWLSYDEKQEKSFAQKSKDKSDDTYNGMLDANLQKYLSVFAPYDENKKIRNTCWVLNVFKGVSGEGLYVKTDPVIKVTSDVWSKNCIGVNGGRASGSNLNLVYDSEIFLPLPANYDDGILRVELIVYEPSSGDIIV